MSEPVPVVVGESASPLEAESASQADVATSYDEIAETDDSDNEAPASYPQGTETAAKQSSSSARSKPRKIRPSSAVYVNDPFNPEDFRAKASPCKCIAVLGFGGSADAPPEVYKVMKQFGQIESVEFARHKDGTSKGYGFIFYRSLTDAKKAVEAANLKGIIIFDRRVRVDYSTTHASGIPVAKNLPSSITGKFTKSEKREQVAKKSEASRRRSRDRSLEKSSRTRSRTRDHGRSRRRSHSRDRDRRRERDESKRRNSQQDTDAGDERRNRDRTSRRDRSRSNDRSSRRDTSGPVSQSIPSIVPLLSKKPVAPPSSSAPSHMPGYPPSLLPPPGYFNPAMYPMAGPHPFMVPSIVYGAPSVSSLVPAASQQVPATSLPPGQEWSAQALPPGSEYATQEHRPDQGQLTGNWGPGYVSGSVNAMSPQQVAWMSFGSNQPQLAASYQQYQQQPVAPPNAQHSSTPNQGANWNQQTSPQQSSARPPGSEAGQQHMTYQQHQFPSQQLQGQQGHVGPYNGISQPQQNGHQTTGNLAYTSGPMQHGYSMGMSHPTQGQMPRPHQIQYE